MRRVGGKVWICREGKQVSHNTGYIRYGEMTSGKCRWGRSFPAYPSRWKPSASIEIAHIKSNKEPLTRSRTYKSKRSGIQSRQKEKCRIPDGPPGFDLETNIMATKLIFRSSVKPSNRTTTPKLTVVHDMNDYPPLRNAPHAARRCPSGKDGSIPPPTTWHGSRISSGSMSNRNIPGAPNP